MITSIEKTIDTNILIYSMDEFDLVAAESAHCGILWTEDLNDGQTIRGVRIENPLKAME